ncbi:reverse transcriptase domain-containing protein [Tanacetum coccineum]
MIRESKFDGYLPADPHDHIREFLAICDMFKYGKTQSEVVKLLIFPFSLCDEAKTWFNELNEGSITSWDQTRRAFINKFFPPSLFNCLLLEIRSFSQNVYESLTEAWLRLKNMLRKCHGHGLTKGDTFHIFYHGLDELTQGILDGTAGGIFLYKSPNQVFQLLEDKVLFKLYWSTKSKNDHYQKFVSLADGSNGNNDNSRLMEKLEALTIKMDSQFQSLKEEMHEMRKNYTNREDSHASKNSMKDDTPMCKRHEANFIQLEGTFLRARAIGLMPMIDQIVGAENPVLMSVAEHIFSAGGKRMRAAFDFEVFGNTAAHSDGAVTTIVKDSESGNDIVNIINCKLSPLVELNKVQEINSVYKGNNVVVPQTKGQIMATTLALHVVTQSRVRVHKGTNVVVPLTEGQIATTTPALLVVTQPRVPLWLRIPLAKSDDDDAMMTSSDGTVLKWRSGDSSFEQE